MTPDYFNEYGFMDRIASANIGGALGVLLIVYLVSYLFVIAYSILVYILQSLGMYTIANRRGIHHPWLAWLPIANMWLLGSISDQYQYVAKGRVRSRRKVLLGLSIATYTLMIPVYVISLAVGVFAGLGGSTGTEMMGVALAVLGMCLVMAVLSILLMVFTYIAFYDLYASSDPDNAVAFLVLSIFFSFLQPFFVFACRKKDKGMPPRKSQIPQDAWQPAPAQSEEPAEEPVVELLAQPAEEWVPVDPEAEPTEEDFADETEE